MALSLQAVFDVSNSSSTASNLSLFINPLTAILVSEFLTDRRKAADSSTHPESFATLGTLDFRVLGDLGSTIPGPGEESTWDEDHEGTGSEPEEGGDP
ncbi:hypothetical protein BV20DRAFT_123703 [Pilatotrama ljubarskyi]|nr:hypothetical protein BV20DRAFT_123703 [Pilatotrama ljubarskyi]